MTDVNQAKTFLNDLMDEIKRKDSLHGKRLEKDIRDISNDYAEDFFTLLNLLYLYFNKKNIGPQSLAIDYLKMVNDMRREGLYFLRNGSYSCENQSMAFKNVYSNNEVMAYYMNALLISQILWTHHFKVFTYFEQNLFKYFNSDSRIDILDIGPGHGFFSQIVTSKLPNYNKLDLVDISESSLNMTKEIIGIGNKIDYHNIDVFDYDTSNKYDFIILGEVIEHLDDPLSLLKRISKFLKTEGILWLTTPTNAPALDHIYLFQNKDEVTELVSSAGLNVFDIIGYYSDNVPEEIATKNKVTELIGLFCKL